MQAASATSEDVEELATLELLPAEETEVVEEATDVAEVVEEAFDVADVTEEVLEVADVTVEVFDVADVEVLEVVVVLVVAWRTTILPMRSSPHR